MLNISNAQNTTMFDNFTIEWEDFNLLICAVPISINISLFTCLPSAGYSYVSDMSCLEETTINFDQTTCQTITTAAMYTTSAPQTTQEISTMASTAAKIQVNNDIKFLNTIFSAL